MELVAVVNYILGGQPVFTGTRVPVESILTIWKPGFRLMIFWRINDCRWL